MLEIIAMGFADVPAMEMFKMGVVVPMTDNSGSCPSELLSPVGHCRTLQVEYRRMR